MNKREFFFGVQSCHKCEEREVGCHSVCEKYISECKKKDELVKKRKEYQTASLHTIGTVSKKTRLDRLYLQV